MRKKLLITSLLSLSASVGFAQNLSDALGEMPYKHPRACEYVLDTRGFNVFSNKNCDVVFLAPLPVEKPVNELSLESNVDLCDSNNSLLETINALTAYQAKLSGQLNEAVEEGNYKKIEKILNQLAVANEQVTTRQKDHARFTKIHASTVSSLFENSVDGNDLHRFYDQNLYLMMELNEWPHIKTALPENSIYSFSFYRPENASAEASSVVSTDIPGFELLAQQSSKQKDVAHVKADRVTGKTQLSLMSTCPMVKKVNNRWVVDKQALKNKVTMNRTYEIPMKVGYGIEARLNSKVAAEVLADLVANTYNHGLSKTQVYNKMLSVSGTEVFTVKIDTDVPLTSKEKLDLEHDVRKRLVDRFLLYFEMRGDLADLQPVEVKAPEGGEVPVQYVGTQCWSKSGFLGIGGSSGCRDYIYTVKEWRNGMSTTEIHDHLAVDMDISEKKQINDVIMMTMSTAFYELEENKPEAKNE